MIEHKASLRDMKKKHWNFTRMNVKYNFEYFYLVFAYAKSVTTSIGFWGNRSQWLKSWYFQNDWRYWQTFFFFCWGKKCIKYLTKKFTQQRKTKRAKLRYCLEQLSICKKCSFKCLSLTNEVNFRKFSVYHLNTVTLKLKLHVFT